MKVIGAGLGRTGTLSLKLALEKLLSGPCYHMAEVFNHPEHIPLWRDAANGKDVDWQSIFGDYVAGVDWPICSFAIPLSKLYPDALILVSNREFESWWKSASTTIFPSSSEAEGEWREMVDALFGNLFTIRLDDKEACHEAFVRHYDNVRASIPVDRRLEWSAGDGWEPICDALGVAVPDEPFPHVNKTEDFLNRRRGTFEDGA